MIVRKIMYALEGFFVGIDTRDRAHLVSRSTGESLCLTEWITPRFTPEDFSMCSVCADTRETQSAFKGNPKPASEPAQVLEAMDSRSYRVVGRGDVYTVTVIPGRFSTCTCPAFLNRPRGGCRHISAALGNHDEPLVDGMLRPSSLD